MGQKPVDVSKLNRYCVVCGREYGHFLDRHCTPDSVVAISREGLFKKTTRYFTCDGRELSESELAELREKERALFQELEKSKDVLRAQKLEAEPVLHLIRKSGG